MKTTISGKITQEYILKFPNTANLTLAKKMYAENKKIFNSVEAARSLIRNYKGAQGEKNRDILGVSFRKQFLALKKELPKGETEKVTDYYLPKSIRRILMLSDIHLPYQNDDALFSAIDFGRSKDVDCVWLNGDTLDFYQLSRFEKDPRQRGFKYELDCMRVFLKGLREIFPKALIIFKVGNHENRYEAYLRNKAPELLDVEEFRLSELLGFTPLRIVELKDKQLAHINDLKVLHYHELPMKSGGVNPARAVFLKTGSSTIGGHYHRKSEHVERTLSGTLIKVYSTGCLCDLYPAYMPFNNWSHGFAYIEVDKTGRYRVENKTIIDGVVF